MKTDDREDKKSAIKKTSGFWINTGGFWKFWIGYGNCYYLSATT
jgi:hypothetical protein